MEGKIESSWDKLFEKLSSWLDSLIISLPNIFLAIIVFVIAYWISRHVQRWTNKYMKKLIKQPSIRSLVSNVSSIVIVILGLVLALSILNLDGTLKSILAGAGVAGLAISLALQGTLSNSFSGLFIAIKDEINIGDWLETNGFSGKVIEINLRNTKIKGPDNNIIVLPNKMIIDTPFKNFGLTQRIRTKITCGVGYESDLDKVKELSINAIAEKYPPGITESIEFYYTDFGESSIDFMIRFWANARENRTALELKSEAIMILKKTFDANDINIPFPIRTIVNYDVNNNETISNKEKVEEN